MDQTTLIQRIRDRVSVEPVFRSLFLAGSFGAGTADSFSDVDFHAVVAPDDLSRSAALFRDLLGEIVPVAFWNQRGRNPVLLNAITDDWLRCDLVITDAGGLSGRARSEFSPLMDLDGHFSALPDALPASATDPARILRLINEFLRVLGLLHVVVGRREYINAAEGAGLLRGHLTELMLEEACVTARGGALHLNRLLPPEDLAALSALPYPSPVLHEVVDAHFRTAQAFRPRALRLCEKLSLAWPDRFEKATIDALARHCTSASVDWRTLRDGECGW